MSDYNCSNCGNDFDVDSLIVVTVNSCIAHACPECETHEYIEEIEEDENWCSECSGTGISSSARVDDSCSSCSGSGELDSDNDDFYEPDSFYEC